MLSLRCRRCLALGALGSAGLHAAALVLWLGAPYAPEPQPDQAPEQAMALDLDLFAPSPAASQPVAHQLQSPVADGPQSTESLILSAAEVPDQTPALPVPPLPEERPVPAPEPEDPPRPTQVDQDRVPKPRPAPDPELPDPESPDPESLPKAEVETKPESIPASKPKPKPKPAPKQKPKPKPESKPKPKPKTDLDRPAQTRRDAAASNKPQTRARRPDASASTRAGQEESKSRTERQSTGASAAEKSRAERAYLAELQRAIGRHQRFPGDARKRQKTGTATLSFVVKADGRIRSVRLAKSSGDPSLDRAALEALHRLDRFKPIPVAIGRTSWSLRVPIRFDLR